MRAPDGTEPSDAEFERALNEIIEMGRHCSTPTGMHVMDPETALRRAAQGMQFIAIGSELRFMGDRAIDVLNKVKPDSHQERLVRY
jgi:4-hydroxy-2-oxoheptanedioate aldolase